MSSRKVYRLLLTFVIGVGGQRSVGAVDLAAPPQAPISTAAKPRIAQTAQSAAKPVSMQVGSAAPGALPGAAPATLWRFMGIPQGIQKLQGATRNRNGNRPNREPTPPMKAIADPANLDPGKGPAINKAAEIKQKEDLAPQKIKALKYLATIGCGCYPGVEEAFAKSLKFGDECTEDVRYEAALAIQEAAENTCAKCGKSCCCTAEMMQLLNDVATGRDADGCFFEPSARVREAACEALLACRRRVPVYPAPPAAPYAPPETPGETIPREPLPGEFVPKESSASLTSRRPSDGNALMNDILGVGGENGRPSAGDGSIAASQISNRKSASRQGSGDASRTAPARALLVGSVVGIDARTGTVDLEFQGNRQPTVGSQFSVHHDYALNSVYQGRVEVVYLARNGRAIGRPVGRLDFAKLGKGDRVTGRITTGGGDDGGTSPASHTIRRSSRPSCVAPPQGNPIPQPPDESPPESTTSAPASKSNIGKQALEAVTRPKTEAVSATQKPKGPFPPKPNGSLTGKNASSNPWRNAVPAKTPGANKPSPTAVAGPVKLLPSEPNRRLTEPTAITNLWPTALSAKPAAASVPDIAPQTSVSFDEQAPRWTDSLFKKRKPTKQPSEASATTKPAAAAKVAKHQMAASPRKLASPIASAWSRLTKPEVGRLNPSPIAPAAASTDGPSSPVAGIVLMED